MTPHSLIVLALAAFAVGFGAPPASAHAMRMKVTVGADLVVETGYSGGDHDGGDVAVTVSTPAKEVVAQGKIGPDGTWKTPLPPPGEYTVVAADDFGHRAEQRIEIGAAPRPQEYKANEPPVSTGLGVVLGIGLIGLATLIGYGFASRKKG